ncbi:MAG: hypothetical protein M3P18_19130 [Actinomycetota bacterium]|nr:hypothetical protein [Actinomycetota bacterium]
MSIGEAAQMSQSRIPEEVRLIVSSRALATLLFPDSAASVPDISELGVLPRRPVVRA